MACRYSESTQEFSVALLEKDLKPNPMDGDEIEARFVSSDGRTTLISKESLRVAALNRFQSEIDRKYTLFRITLVIDESWAIADTDLAAIRRTASDFFRKIPGVFEARILRIASEPGTPSPITKDLDKLEAELQREEPHNAGSGALFETLNLAVRSGVSGSAEVPLNLVIATMGGSDLSDVEFKTASEEWQQSFQNGQAFIAVAHLGPAQDDRLKGLPGVGLYSEIRVSADIGAFFDKIAQLLNQTWTIHIPTLDHLDSPSRIEILRRRRDGTQASLHTIVVGDSCWLPRNENPVDAISESPEALKASEEIERNEGLDPEWAPTVPAGSHQLEELPEPSIEQRNEAIRLIGSKNPVGERGLLTASPAVLRWYRQSLEQPFEIALEKARSAQKVIEHYQNNPPTSLSEYRRYLKAFEDLQIARESFQSAIRYVIESRQSILDELVNNGLIKSIQRDAFIAAHRQARELEALMLVSKQIADQEDRIRERGEAPQIQWPPIISQGVRSDLEAAINSLAETPGSNEPYELIKRRVSAAQRSFRFATKDFQKQLRSSMSRLRDSERLALAELEVLAEAHFDLASTALLQVATIRQSRIVQQEKEVAALLLGYTE